MADHTVNRIDHANHLLLDQPLIRLPYELIHQNIRGAHFTVEKDGTYVQKLLRETANDSLQARATPDDVLCNLDAMIARMRGIKRKLTSHADEEARLYRQVDARVRHLADLAGMHTLDDVKYEAWSRKRLDRLLVDYLLRHGYNESARALADDHGLGDLVDVETFVQSSKIQTALRNRSVKEALEWCIENKKELRKMDSNLEFQLRFQQYIELVRQGQEEKLVEAIGFAKKHLWPLKESFPEEYGSAGLLLAYPPPQAEGLGPDLKHLYSLDRWETLAQTFTETHNTFLALPSHPLLHIALQVGLSALKTPACHSVNEGPAAASSASSSVCPICSTELNALAKNVPYAHHSQSHVDNDLLLLPNSRVYGKSKLEEHAKKSGLPSKMVKDLRTGEVFPVDTLKKVFIT